MGMLLKLVAELPEAKAQQLGGAGLNTPRALEGHLDVALLHPIEDVVEIQACRWQVDRDFPHAARRRQRRWQGVDAEDLTASQHDRPLDDVFELANVAGPVIVLEHDERIGRHRRHALAELARELLDEVSDEEGNVLAPIPKGRQVDRDDVESIKEVLAEQPVGHRLAEVTVGRGDESHVDLDVPGVAHATNLALLDGPQELYLDGRRDLRDLVEEQRAAFGRREQSLGVGHRAGEGAFEVAEQLRLHESFRDRAAVHGHEGAVPPAALVMDGQGDELLSRPAFPGDHHRRGSVRRLANGVEHLEHPPAVPHEVLEPALFGELALERDVLVLESLALERLFDGQAHLVELEGLGDVIVAVELAHAQVADHQVEAVALQRVDGVLATVGERHVVAGLSERDAQEITHAALVVDDEDASGGHRVTAVAAAAGRISTALVPPLAPPRRLTSPP